MRRKRRTRRVPPPRREGRNTSTIRQFAEPTFDYIVSYKEENDGNSPSMRQIMDEVGISSTSVVNNVLLALEDARRISRAGEGTFRSISVIGGRWTYKPDPVELVDKTTTSD